MQDRLCFCLFKVLGAHKALVASSAGAYGRSDGLPHSLLSPSYSWLPPPSFFLLLLFCGEMNGPPVCCVRISLWQTPLCTWCACVRSACTWICRIGSGIYGVCLRKCLCGCVWPGHLVLCMQAWSRLISCLQKLAIKSWSGCQFKWNEMEPESN